MNGTRNEEATAESTPDAVEINALLAELRVAGNAVCGKEWLSPELAGDPVVSIDVLGSNASPLSGLDSAGVGFLTPMVSFLEEPLGQLRGDPDSVTSGAGEFDGAAQGATSVAEEYRTSAGSETSEWSGQAATDYLSKGIELADGILSVAETSLTASKSMIGAGEVVAQVVGTVTQLVTEAVGKIVPIMTQAVAQAPVTFGQSIAVAIPQCVQIAVDYAGRITGKLAALLSSGENLLKLIDGALGALQIVKSVLGFIGEQAQSGGGSPATATGEQSQPSDQSPSRSSEQDTTPVPATEELV